MSPDESAARSLQSFEVRVQPRDLAGILALPDRARSLVLFAHGSGSSRLSPRNRAVAKALNDVGIATLLFDLLTEREERDRRNVFDIELLSERLEQALDWVRGDKDTRMLRIGLFGASTGAAAALVVAAQRPDDVGAVVSRGGRPDLAFPYLARVKAPTLLIVGGADLEVLALNEDALAQMTCEKKLSIVAGATHLFSEPGALEEAIASSTEWFSRYLEH